MAVEWGDLPGWLSAFGSVFALVFAAIVVVVTRRMYQIESERDRVNAEARSVQESFARRAQAALVSTWWGESRDEGWGAFVRNASETPVYQVYLTVLDPDDHSDGIKVHYLVVPPSDDALFCPIDNDRPAQRTTDRRVKLSFTDAAGVRWLRNQYGLLTELQPNLRIKADPSRARLCWPNSRPCWPNSKRTSWLRMASRSHSRRTPSVTRSTGLSPTSRLRPWPTR